MPTVIPIRSVPGLRPGIDLKADGGYVILPPSRTPNGTYRFTTPENQPALPLPPGLLLVPRRGPTNPDGTPIPAPGTGLTPAAIEAILADPTQLQPGQRDQFFFAAARDLRRERGLTYQQTLEALTRVYEGMHNPPNDHFPLHTVHAKVANAYQDPHHAHDPAPTPATTIPTSLLAPTQPAAPDGEDTIVATGFGRFLRDGGWDGTWAEDDPLITLTALGTARLLHRAVGHRLRFNTETKQWYVCQLGSNLWVTDPVNGAARRVVEDFLLVLRTFAAEHMSTTDAGQQLARWTLNSETPEFCARVLRALEQNVNLHLEPSDLNPHHLLPVQNGVLDVATWETHVIEGRYEDGTPILYRFQDLEEEAEYNLLTRNRFRPIQPEDLITEPTKFDFFPEMLTHGQRTIHEWDELIAGWFPNQEVARFAQRLLGYAVFGHDDQKLFVVAHGRPNSGKSAFFNNLEALLGRYAIPIMASAITHIRGQSRDERNLAFVNAHGTKLLIASESPPDAHFNLDVLKALTGGDPIIVRGMRENGAPLRNHGMLVLMTNHMPSNQALDDALWKRLVVLPFENEFEPGARGTLPAEVLRTVIKESSEAVIHWLLRGYIDFVHGGLRPPTPIITAKVEVQEDQDWLGQFLADHVQARAGDAPPIELRDLYDVYVAWAHVNKEEPVHYKMTFAPAVRQRLTGYVRRTPQKRWALHGHRVVTGPAAQEGS